MKIYDVNLSSTAAETGRTQEAQLAARDGAHRSGRASAAGDRVELSNTLNSLARAVSSYNSGRASRVQALTAQFRSGSYQPDSLAASRGIIAEALATGGE